MLPFVYLTLPQASLASPNGKPQLLPPTKTLNKKKKGKRWGRKKKERKRFSDSGCPAFRAQVTRMLLGDAQDVSPVMSWYPALQTRDRVKKNMDGFFPSSV